MQSQDTQRNALPVQGIEERTLQAAWRQIDGAEDGSGQEKMRGESTEQVLFRTGALWGLVSMGTSWSLSARIARARAEHYAQVRYGLWPHQHNSEVKHEQTQK